MVATEQNSGSGEIYMKKNERIKELSYKKMV
jgi:hypothetical protein